MKLSERLGRAQASASPGRQSLDEPVVPVPGAVPQGGATESTAPDASDKIDADAGDGGVTVTAAPEETRQPDALAGLKAGARDQLFERLGNRLTDSSMDEKALRDLVMREVNVMVNASSVPLKSEERRRLVAEIADDVLGYGPLQKLLDDDSVTEIMVNGHENVFVERDGLLQRVDVQFSSDEHLRRVIERIVGRVGRRIDESSPMVDARLEDGSRVNAIIPPLSVSGSTVTVRKFGKVPLRTEDLVARGSMSMQMAELLRACVEAKLNVLVTGGTGTGKTTLLNVLSSFIPARERIVTIEDAVELQLQQGHVVRLESRPPNIEGQGAVAIRDLVRNSLRMRPDRIIVGEVRGGESLDMLQAMNTGHEGSLSTLHANTPRDAIARLETMVLMAGMDLPLRAIREQIASAVDVIVHLNRLRDGTRRVTNITEVQGMEGDIVTLQDAFTFDFGAGVDSNGRFLGHAIPTGVRPLFTERFAEQGIQMPPGIFDEMFTSRGAR